MKFGPRIISEENAEEEHITVNGPLNVLHNLKTKKIVVNGPITVEKVIEIVKEGSLVVNGPMIVKNNFICNSEARINGILNVHGEILGGVIKVNGKLDASNLNVKSIAINGNIDIEYDIKAEDFVQLSISPSSEINIGGIIEAPLIKLRAKDKISMVNVIKKFVGKKSKTIINLSGIKLKTDLLQLHGISVEGEIEAKEIEEVE